MDIEEIRSKLSGIAYELDDVKSRVDTILELVNEGEAVAQGVDLPPVGSIVRVNTVLDDGLPGVGALGRVVSVNLRDSHIAVEFAREFTEEHSCGGAATHGRYFYADEYYADNESLRSLDILERAN